VRIGSVLILVSIVALGGCATVVRGPFQEMQVVTDPPGAECSLGNGRDASLVIVSPTPGNAQVHRDRTPLQVRCAKDGYLVGTESYEATRGNEGDTRGQRQQLLAGQVAIGGAIVGLEATALATAAPVAGGAAIAGAGLVAAPLLVAALVAVPVAMAVDYSTGAMFSYPSAVSVLLVPLEFPDELARAEYFATLDRRLDLADEAMRRYTAETCWWNCDFVRDKDDTVIAERRTRFAELRAKTTIANPER
jgi:hypothetical protein